MGSLGSDFRYVANKQIHVLVFTLPAPSHIGPFLQLVHHIDAHCPGAKVSLVIPTSFVSKMDDLKRKGDFASIDLVTEEIPGMIPIFKDDPKFPVRVAQITEQAFLETEPLRRRIAEKKGTSDAVTAIICDGFLFWGKTLADELGIPCYGYFPSSPMGLVSILEHPKLLRAKVDPYAPGMAEKALPAVMPDLVKAPGLSYVRLGDIPPERFQFPEFFPPLTKAALNMTGMIINSAPELDVSFGAVQALDELLGSTKTFYIGPSVQLPGFGKVLANVPTDNVSPWLDSQRQKSVLYVSFGSLGKVTKESLLELAAGLEASGVPFLWALKVGSEKLSDIFPAGFLERTADRGLIDTSWVNQTAILQHPAVGGFLTHCGWNSLLETICSGIPCVAWPLAAEQMINARYVDNVAKIGVAIASFKEKEKHKFDDVKEKEITIAIRKVMVDEDRQQFVTNVSQLQEFATKAVQKGGSSYQHRQRFLNAISS